MKCVSCGTVIPPEWKAAIKNNKCPACDGVIMNDNMQELLVELRDALTAMPNDAEGIAGWLLSHYQLTKIGTGEPVAEFFGDRKNVKTEGGLKVAPNKLAKFYKQANAKSPEEYAQLAKKLGLNEGVDYGDDAEGDASENEEDLDPEYEQQALSAMQGQSLQDSRKQMRQLNKQTGLPNQNGLAWAEDLHPALNADRMDRLQKQQEISMGKKFAVQWITNSV